MENIQLILEIIIIILGLYMAFFKSYFSEYGKQIALKEHIEELTNKVETVKAEIELFTKTKFDLASNERNSILKFHTDYYEWRNSVLELFPSVIDDNNYNSYRKVFNLPSTKKIICDNSSNSLDLFLNDKKFSKLKTKVFLGCMELQNISEKYFNNVAYEYMVFNHTKKVTKLNDHLEIQKRNYDSISKIIKEFTKKQSEQFKLLIPFENELNNYLREHLFKDIKSN